MRAVLVVPALLTAGASLSGMASLGRLAAWSAAPLPERDGVLPALVAAAGLPGDTAPAPLAARGAGLALATGDVQYADPVTLVAGRDDVLFAGRVDDLAPDASAALVAHLNAHFATDGLRFVATRPDAWFLASHDIALPETTALTALDRPIASALPRGPHAKAWRRWLSEMQMLLHEHPVNQQREAEGRAPITGVWPWGGGSATAMPAAASVTYAGAGRAGDLARGIGAEARPLPATFMEIARDRDALIVLPRIAAADALPALARDWLAPLVAELAGGTLDEAVLVADDGAVAYTWRARRPSSWARLRARVASPTFQVPTGTP